MKFGKIRINASVIIALLAALYILMVCREKYYIEYAEGEPAPEEVVTEEPIPEVGEAMAETAPKETAPVVGEAIAQMAPKKEGMSAMTIAGIAMGSIFGLLLIIFMLRTLRMRRFR